MAVQLGIVGAGAIAEHHAKAASELAIPVVAVADTNKTQANQFAKQFNVKRSYYDPTQLFADTDVTGVIVCVPNFLHRGLAIEALKAGKDVLLEKPMGLDQAECDQINRTAESAERIVQIGFVHRYTAVGLAAAEAIAAGQLGTIYHAKAHYLRRRGVPGLGRWFTQRSLSGGGALIDLGVHLIDLALHLMGDLRPTRVSASTYSKFGCRMQDYVYERMWAGPPDFSGSCDVEDSVHALVHFDQGATLDLQVAWAMNIPDETVADNLMGLFGDAGGLTFPLFGDHLNLATEQQGHNVDTRILVAESDPFAGQLRAFCEAVESRVPPSADGRQGRRVQAVVDAIYQSSREQQCVALDEPW